MIKHKMLTIVLVLLLAVALLAAANFVTNGASKNLFLQTPLAGKFVKQSSSPVPSSAISTPKTFKFDRSTDLKKELDSINPQVLDSDF